MNIALSNTLHTSFADAIAQTRGALAEQGFGVLNRNRHEGDLESRRLWR